MVYGNDALCTCLCTESTDVLNNALIKAVSNGNLKEVKALIKKCADTHSIQTYVNAIDNSDRTALMQASDLEIVKLLIKNGASVNAKGEHGGTALLKASQGGHLEVIKFLVENGSDVNPQEIEGWTALE